MTTPSDESPLESNTNMHTSNNAPMRGRLGSHQSQQAAQHLEVPMAEPSSPSAHATNNNSNTPAASTRRHSLPLQAPKSVTYSPAAGAAANVLSQSLASSTTSTTNANVAAQATATATTTTPSPRRKPASVATRKVLRPLRSVGRRLTGRFSVRAATDRRKKNETYETFSEQTTNGGGGGGSGSSRGPLLLPNHRSNSFVESAVSSLRHLATRSPVILSPSSSDPMHHQHQHHHQTGSSSSVGTAVSAKDRDWIVYRLEYFLRHACLVLGAYCLGVYRPGWVIVARKLAEYGTVALITCWVIIVSAAFQGRLQPNAVVEHEEVYYEREVGYESEEAMDERQPLLMDLEQDVLTVQRDLEAADMQGEEPDSPTDLVPIQKVVHPALEPFFAIDIDAEKRIFPNACEAFEIDTDFFTGSMMILLRTPDVDDPSAVKGSPENAASSRYFTGKQRHFEFQFQIRLKKLPTGRVYFACELEEAFKLGMIQRAFVGAAMAFVKTTNSSFHYNMTGSTESADGRYENPHMAFPVEGSMDRVVATPPGQPIPNLGGAIYEDPESLKRRKKGGLIEWNLEDTYTMALWSAYVDFLDWRCLNLPGIRPFDLCNVIGTQPIILTLYEIPDNRGNEKHYVRDISKIIRIEFSNAIRSGLGRAARQWRSKHRDNRLLTDDTPGQLEDEQSLDEMQEDSDDDAATLAELGEGIYVRSGDTITLRGYAASETEEDGVEASYVAIGRGFAVLQERTSTNIIIEKVERSRSRKSTRSKLIKSGDTVMFKLVTKGRNDKSEEFVETKYLTIHRGWWLKWVGTAPTKNGYFTIHTHETEFSEQGSTELRMAETQSSYLSLGGSFWLRHKRWKRNLVGVAAEGSATYGGRILGLYTPKHGPSFQEDPNDLSGEEHRADPDQPEAGERDKSEWMVPLTLRAYEGTCTTTGVSSLPKAASDDVSDEGLGPDGMPRLVFSSQDHRMDVPAWLEIMNRTERIRQLTYAVRVLPPSVSIGVDDNEDEPRDLAFMRLRTGRELASAMRTGLNWRNSTPHGVKKSPRYVDTTPPSPKRGEESDVTRTPSPRRTRDKKFVNPSAAEIASVSAYTFDEVEDTGDDPEGEGSSDEEWEVDSGEDVDLVEYDDEPGTSTGAADKRSKGRKFIGKIAKSVKTKTASTGKTVVRQSVKVGKGTVNAGKAITRIAPIRPKIPRSVEPKAAKSGGKGSLARKRREKDLHLAVGGTTKERDKFETNSSLADSRNMLAGQLSAPEQSCRSVSNMLSVMSNLPPSSPMSASFSALLAAQVEQKTAQDNGFLHGGALQLGVVPSKVGLSQGPILSECLVARCLWESHWREEWAGLYEKGLAFYAPLSRSPCLELAFADVQSVRFLDAGARNPLPGYPILVIETAWLCHYAAFADQDAREAFRDKMEEAKAQCVDNCTREKELWKARFWQGFQNSLESSLSSGKGKWAEVVSGTKAKRRTVINNRKMVFDLDPERAIANEFVEGLLSTSLSFSLHSLEEHPEALVSFLDSTSRLRSLSLEALDLTSESAFCLFVNLYHCLLQHALLLSVNGGLHKKSFGNFMTTSCYEIGGDVFSLAELYCCIIRGNMARPLVSKAPYIDVSKKSSGYRHYALSYASPYVNFVLNTGDVSCPRGISILKPSRLGAQLNFMAGAFLQRNLVLDESRKIIFIPKLCEAYRNDFAGDALSAANTCLHYCLQYAPDPLRTKISTMLIQESSVTIKYLPTAEQYHTSLSLVVVDVSAEETEE